LQHSIEHAALDFVQRLAKRRRSDHELLESFRVLRNFLHGLASSRIYCDGHHCWSHPNRWIPSSGHSSSSIGPLAHSGALAQRFNFRFAENVSATVRRGGVEWALIVATA
jgi:hypothetical protein